MFGGLVARHHDGILISAGDKLIMHNSRISEIFKESTLEKGYNRKFSKDL